MKIKMILALFALSVILQCGSGNSISKVYLYFNSDPDQTKISKDITTGIPPTDVKEIIISVYEEAYPGGNLLFKKNYPKELSVAEILIESGDNRVFVVETTDANKYITHRGHSAPVNLTPGGTTDVSITMNDPIVIPTATLNIKLVNSDGSDFDPSNEPNLLNNSVRLSVVTLNSPIFNQNANDIKIGCANSGDFFQPEDNNKDKSMLTSTCSIKVPAKTFVFIVARGYHNTQSCIKYIGAANPSDTGNLDENAAKNIQITMKSDIDNTNLSDCQCN